MTTSPALLTVVTDIRTALEAIEEALTPHANAAGVSFHQQAGTPHWTNQFSTTSAVKVGTSLWRFDLTVRAIYHGAPLTAGQGGEHEIAAQALMLQTAVIFAERPDLNCAAFPSGPRGLSAEGIGVESVAVGTTDVAGVKCWAVVATINIPLLLHLDEGF